MNTNTSAQIIKLSLAGLKPSVIAERTGVSVNTVKSHIRRHKENGVRVPCLFCGRPVQQTDGEGSKKSIAPTDAVCGTGTENTAKGRSAMATDDIYSPQKLMGYHLAVAMIERLAWESGLSETEKNRLLGLLAKRYGFDKRSIFIR